jgi:hypothetical protein
MTAEPGDLFNACEYLLDRVQRTASGLRELGLQPERSRRASPPYNWRRVFRV